MRPLRGEQHLVLAGAGHAHLQVLRAWGRQLPEGFVARQAGQGLRITLVSPYPHLTYSGMVPGHLAGRYTLAQCQVSLAQAITPLASQAAAHPNLRFEWRQLAVVGVQADARQVLLSNGQTLDYDWLSLDVGGAPERAAIAGAAEHALFVRPIERFASVWPRLQALCQRQVVHVAVVGGGAGGVELALGLRQALQRLGSRGGGAGAEGVITLLTGGSAQVNALLPAHSPGTRRRVAVLLRQRGITVLQDRLTAVEPGRLRLASGAALQCDAPLLATPVVGPAWLRSSGLALDEQGFVQTGPTLQSTSHATVLAAGDVASRVDVRHPRSGVYALRAGKPLARNLALLAAGLAPLPWTPQRTSLNLLDTADGGAVLSWGPLSAGGALTRPLWGAWKRWLDEGFVRSFG